MENHPPSQSQIGYVAFLLSLLFGYIFCRFVFFSRQHLLRLSLRGLSFFVVHTHRHILFDTNIVFLTPATLPIPRQKVPLVSRLSRP
jgi:hypothetical protein